ncbi:hypothetical protein D3C80_1690750 [compost metagenome]
MQRHALVFDLDVVEHGVQDFLVTTDASTELHVEGQVEFVFHLHGDGFSNGTSTGFHQDQFITTIEGDFTRFQDFRVVARGGQNLTFVGRRDDFERAALQSNDSNHGECSGLDNGQQFHVAFPFWNSIWFVTIKKAD